MIIEFKTTCSLTLEHDGKNKPKHRETKFNLEVSPNLDRAAYLNKGMPTAEGASVITQIFIQGLIANIHACHQKKYRDSADHLRYIMAELQRGFIEVVTIDEGFF